MDEEKSNKEAPITEYTHNLVNLALDIAQAGKPYFFGGGFAVDFSVGKITRNHHDIDFHPRVEDIDWWLKWFQDKGYTTRKFDWKGFEEVYKVEQGDDIVDLWPFKLEDNKLMIKRDGEYVETERRFDEVRTVKFQGIDVCIENPLRVLEQKQRHADKGEDMRPQDEHDFALLGKQPGSSKIAS